MSRLMIVLSGIAGATGIMAAAAAFHLGGDNIQIASQFLLFHAPVFLVVGTRTRPCSFCRARIG